ncbi:hypothetical protein EXU57_20680 [Segetibacter sp. 3557_3]|uniref:hypothetical protein n=1 Tax=Segetibacter sp. 3557_3 TaxID=2547429 RepID=UPI001058DEE0|nr:hypothetical protein [Segetibacter sp. 3557_3]TDH20814.1 hypothetical protein EXU57_20680 [Segetibacter sp. 3557_3]
MFNLTSGEQSAVASRRFTDPANLFVWSIWFIMLVVALVYVFVYGRNLPLEEDWNMVSALTGNQQDIATWLWEQNNEHRIPFPKLVLHLLLKITNGDFRCGMVLNICSSAGIAAMFIAACKKLRGKTNYVDAFFPIAFLHMGNWENFYWSWQFTLILSTFLTCILIAIVANYTRLLTTRLTVLASVCMMALPLSGANGLLYLVPVVPWLTYECYFQFKSKEQGGSRLNAYLILVSLIITVVFVFMYFDGYYRPWWNPPNPGIYPTLKTSIKFLALAFGPAAILSWTISTLAALLINGSTLYILLRTLLKVRGPEFRRAFALLLFLGGSIVFALAMGWGRAAWVPTFGMPIRYVLLALPSLITCYFSWLLYGSKQSRVIIPASLFLAMALLIIPNSRKGFIWRDWYLDGTRSVMTDIENGVPHGDLATKHFNFLLHSNKKRLSDRMLQLKEAGIGPFKQMKVDSDNKNTAPTQNIDTTITQ